ncbi:hypothetical protein EVAR_45618_1 [Eumeta japonica]|uniref:Uncharacterized protein n=1 Tax=Eumeta variegata TaxID=151549 RepID=A0A4C1WHE3_EUMVA|nr:hypothetical protein EVAR_45618_1 [Eumeta japonica]
MPDFRAEVLEPRTKQKLASGVKTYFKKWIDKNEEYLALCNLTLIYVPEKQWKTPVEAPVDHWESTWTTLGNTALEETPALQNVRHRLGDE